MPVRRALQRLMRNESHTTACYWAHTRRFSPRASPLQAERRLLTARGQIWSYVVGDACNELYEETDEFGDPVRPCTFSSSLRTPLRCAVRLTACARAALPSRAGVRRAHADLGAAGGYAAGWEDR